MKIATLCTTLALPLALAACYQGDSEEMAAEIEAEATDVDAGQSLAVDTVTAAVPGGEGGGGGMTMSSNLQPLNGSGTSGQATLTPSGGQLQASVQLTGAPPGERPGHIHRGTCDNIGPVAAPLPSVTADANGSGSASGAAAFSADSLMAGQFVVNYHGAGGTPIACGPIGH